MHRTSEVDSRVRINSSDNFALNYSSVKFLDDQINKDYQQFQKDTMPQKMLTLLAIQLSINIGNIFFAEVSFRRNISSYLLLALTGFALGSILVSSNYLVLSFKTESTHRLAKFLGVYCFVSSSFLFFSLIFWESLDAKAVCEGIHGTWNIVLILIPLGIMITIQQGFLYNFSIILGLSVFLICTEILAAKFSKPWCQIPWTAGILPMIACIPLAYIHEKSLKLQYASFRASQQASETAKQEATNANLAKRDFLSYIFHEIRVPLNAISMGVDMLQTTRLESKLPGFAENDVQQILRAQLDTATNILDDVLSLQKIEEGKFEIRKEFCNLKKFVDMINWTYSKLLEDKRIKYSWLMDKNLPSVVLMDKYRVRQVVSNFLTNAAKFVPAGGSIHLQVTLDEVFEEREVESEDLSFNFRSTVVVKKQNIRFAVEDTGIGISKEDQDKLFQPFTQVDSGKAQQGKGTGLGLSIAKHIVRLHGGEIGVRSKEGEGSCFFFKIPLEAKPEDDGAEDITSVYVASPRARRASIIDAEEVREIEAGGPSSTEPQKEDDQKECTEVDEPQAPDTRKVKTPTAAEAGARKPKVLLVEDSIPNRKLLERMIVSWGFECFTATNGVECVDLFSGRAESPFDLVITDQEMPLMNGDEAIRRLRGLGFRMPIVALTGNAFDDQRSLLLAAGADAFLTKPTTADKLKACILSFIKT